MRSRGIVCLALRPLPAGRRAAVLLPCARDVGKLSFFSQPVDTMLAHHFCRFVLLVLLALAAAVASAARLTAGPMAGPAGMRSAVIWLQADAAALLRLEYQPEGSSSAKPAQVTAQLAESADYSARLELVDLQPGTTYRYRLLLDGSEAASGTLRTQALWQWRSEPPASRVLLGSCAYLNDPAYDRPGRPYGGDYEIFASMAAQRPDLTLWLGDNIYFREADYASPWGMAYRYRRDRALAELQPLLRTGQHAAIWDDHDFGPNNSGAGFIFKEQSLALFQRYWPNPSYGLPEARGIFTVVRQGDADFFLLDNRWNRDVDRLRGEPNKQMFGAPQMRWLKNALLQSTATFKIIAGGSQFLNDHNLYEGWLNFPEERAEFLRWLDKQALRGVFFLSGDRHFTELLKLERAARYPLYELTCSPLTSSAFATVDESRNARLVSGTLVRERNFCALDFHGPLGKREIVVRSFSAKGKALWEKVLTEAELGHEAPVPRNAGR